MKIAFLSFLVEYLSESEFLDLQLTREVDISITQPIVTSL